MSFTYKLITSEKPHSFESEQYRKLRTNIDYLSINKDYKVISVTSSMANEGKTYTALNLANVYAQNHVRTIIVDMDLRNPKVHRAFSMINDKGLTNCAEKNFVLDNFLFPVNEFLDVLPSGTHFPFPAELLSTNQVTAIIEELRTRYDKVIIDTPPISLFTDAKIIANFSDGVLFVVASKKTKIDIAKNAINELRLSNIDIIGSVLTRVPIKKLSYGKGYYYNKYIKK